MEDGGRGTGEGRGGGGGGGAAEGGGVILDNSSKHGLGIIYEGSGIFWQEKWGARGCSGWGLVGGRKGSGAGKKNVRGGGWGVSGEGEFSGGCSGTLHILMSL